VPPIGGAAYGQLEVAKTWLPTVSRVLFRLGVGGSSRRGSRAREARRWDRPKLGMPRMCRSETTAADHERQPTRHFLRNLGRIQRRRSPERTGMTRAVGSVVPKTKRAKQPATTTSNMPAIKKPSSVRPMSSRPPVAARVDIVVANLERDPRRK